MRILLVRLRQIGDVVLTTPAIAAVARRFPGARLTYIVEPPAAPIVRHNSHLSEVIVAPPARGLSGLLGDLKVGRRLRATHYDLAIDFHGGPRASLLTWLSGAPMRIGYNVRGRSWMYTHVVARPAELRRRHSVQNQWDLLTPLNIAAPTAATNPLEMPAEREAARRVAARLTARGVGAGDAIAVVHVSATSAFRRWPAASFVETVATLAAPGRWVVVTSGPADRAASHHVVEEARQRVSPNDGNRIITGDDLSLTELRALLDRSAVYIGGDSGPLHVAATTHVPIVALFGPTPSERSAPWRDPADPAALLEVDGLACRPCDQRTCIPGDFRCLTGITAERVIAAVDGLLAGRGQLDYDR
jgi:ADP-heptose:LPS heptosyltransferase